MKNIGIVLVAIILTACSSVQGVVRDKETGTPIPSAYVTVNRSSAVTNAVGHYHVIGSFVPGDIV